MRGVLQMRITTSKTGSITSVQAICVPADDLTDRSPATTFAHLNATVALRRQLELLVIRGALLFWLSGGAVEGYREVGQLRKGG